MSASEKSIWRLEKRMKAWNEGLEIFKNYLNENKIELSEYGSQNLAQLTNVARIATKKLKEKEIIDDETESQILVSIEKSAQEKDSGLVKFIESPTFRIISSLALPIISSWDSIEQFLTKVKEKTDESLNLTPKRKTIDVEYSDVSGGFI